jgi:hypothetical protein
MAGLRLVMVPAVPPEGSARPIPSAVDRDRPFEVLATPGAQRPIKADEPFAVGANAIQPGPTPGADDPFVVDAAIASPARLDRFHLGQKRFLGQVPLVYLAQALGRSDDPIDDHAQDEQKRSGDQDDGGGNVRQGRILGPVVHVAEGPVGSRQPDHEEVDDDRVQNELHDGAREERIENAPELSGQIAWHELGSLSIPPMRSIRRSSEGVWQCIRPALGAGRSLPG